MCRCYCERRRFRVRHHSRVLYSISRGIVGVVVGVVVGVAVVGVGVLSSSIPHIPSCSITHFTRNAKFFDLNKDHKRAYVHHIIPSIANDQWYLKLEVPDLLD